MDDYLAKLKKVIAEKAAVEPTDVKLESYFEDDLNMGEMELMELFDEVEEKFAVELTEDDRDACMTVEDLIDLFVEKLD